MTRLLHGLWDLEVLSVTGLLIHQLIHATCPFRAYDCQHAHHFTSEYRRELGNHHQHLHIRVRSSSAWHGRLHDYAVHGLVNLLSYRTCRWLRYGISVKIADGAAQRWWSAIILPVEILAA